MRISKWLKGIGLVIALAAGNAGLNFMLEPNYGSANLMWQDLAEEEEIDLIYVGSSLCQRNIDPLIVDEVTGRRSYNMGTSAQTLLVSKDAIQTAYERFGIRQAVLVVGYSTFDKEQGSQSDIAWLRAKERFDIEEGMNRLDFVLDETHFGRTTSVNFLIPWVNHHVNFLPGEILKNVREKVNGVDAITSELNHSRTMVYSGRGHEGYTGAMDPDEAGWDTSLRTYANEFSPVQTKQLEEICAYCRKENIELIVINAPKPMYDILAYGEAYDADGDKIREIVEPYGFAYYDFGLLRPDVLSLDSSHAVDKEHLNRAGVEWFSAVLGEYLVRLERGEDIRGDFLNYQQEEDRIDVIHAVYFEAHSENGKISLHGESYGGKDVEYRYMQIDGDTYNDIREFSSDPDCVTETEGHGIMRIRLEVRCGSEVKSCEKDVLY